MQDCDLTQRRKDPAKGSLGWTNRAKSGLTTSLICGFVVLPRLAIGAERIMANYGQIIIERKYETSF